MKTKLALIVCGIISGCATQYKPQNLSESSPTLRIVGGDVYGTSHSYKVLLEPCVSKDVAELGSVGGALISKTEDFSKLEENSQMIIKVIKSVNYTREVRYTTSYIQFKPELGKNYQIKGRNLIDLSTELPPSDFLNLPINFCEKGWPQL
ncbi:hypothetical protein [Vibrio penaeicida]|nr:hypothetical protein [Vibrio penaeicida]RTZ19372.1 hypothetical protein EKN09_27270 [Vibrio penaeicida]